MAFLGELGVVKRGVGCFKISAAVLLVGIEEEGIQPPVEIVVTRDIVLRTAGRIELPDMPDQVAQPPLQLAIARQYFRLIHQDRQSVRDRAFLDDEGALRVDFTERKLGVEQNPAFGIGGEESHGDRLPGPVAAAEICSARGGKCHRAAADELLQEITQQTVHRNHRI